MTVHLSCDFSRLSVLLYDKVRRTEARVLPDVLLTRRILARRWFDFVPNVSVMNQTDRQTDGQQDDANSRSYYV